MDGYAMDYENKLMKSKTTPNRECYSNLRRSPVIRGKLISATLVVASLMVPANMMAQEATGPTPAIAPAPPEANRPPDTSHQSDSNGNGDRPALQERYPRYQVTRSDVLSLSFPLSPELNRNVTVQPDGYINLQSTKSVYVQGLTIPEIIAALKKAYTNVLKDPIIDVDLVDFQKPFFIAGGQVGKPGQYELRHDTTVSQAIAMAGGISTGGKTQIFLYHQSAPGLMEVKKLNLKDIYNGKNVNEDALLHPGDTLFVPEKFITNFRKYVPYSIGAAFNPQTAFVP
jgi:polysaccharide biosynthesis/export protein